VLRGMQGKSYRGEKTAKTVQENYNSRDTHGDLRKMAYIYNSRYIPGRAESKWGRKGE
jgi:hypothetical protein